MRRSLCQWLSRSAALLSVCTSASLAGQPAGTTAGFAVERQWSDKSGSHKIAGRLQFADDAKVQLLTSAGKTFQITTEQLSEADRVFVQAFLAAEKASPAGGGASPFEVVDVGTASPVATSTSATPALSDLDLPADIKDVAEAKVRRGSARVGGWKVLEEFWNTKPPVASAFKGDRDVTLTSNLKSLGERSVAVGGGVPRAFVTTHNEWNGKGDTTLAIFDYASGEVVAEAEFGIPLKAMAISPSGRLIAAVWVEGHGKGNYLYLFDVRDHDLRPIYKIKAGNGAWDEILSAQFLGNGRLLTVSQKKRVSVWDLSATEVARSEVGQMIGGSIELSPAGDQLAMIDGKAVGILDSKTMKHVGCIIPPSAPLSVSFAADGKSIAVRSEADLHVYSTIDGKLVKTIPTGERGGGVKHFGRYALVGNRLYDLKSGIPVWKYGWGANAAAAGNVLVGRSPHARELAATFAAVPDVSVETRLGSVDPNTLYVFKPGMAVGIDVTAPDNQYMTADAIRAGLTAIVEKNGWRLDPSAAVRFSAVLERLRDEEFQYVVTEQRHPFLSMPFHGESINGKEVGRVNFTPWKSTVKLLAGDKVLWQEGRHDGAPGGAPLNEGETVEQAIRRVVRPDLKFFETAIPPSHVIAPELLDGFGDTDLK